MIVSLWSTSSAARWVVALALAAATPQATNDVRQDDAPAAEPAGSLDDELFKELEDDAADAKPAKPDAASEDPAKLPEQPEDADQRPQPSEIDRELLEELGGAEEEAQDPLERISGRMREVEKRLARSRAGDDTQHLQEEIVAGLDELIKEAMRRAQRSSSQSAGGKSDQNAQRSRPSQPQSQSQSSSSSDQQSQQPARDSTERLGPDRTGRPDPNDVRDLVKRLWGHLPEREREQMLNASIEQFLPKYEVLIEQYFRRLAEEQQQRDR